MCIKSNDPRVSDMYELIEQMPQKITKENLAEIIHGNEDFVMKILQEDFIMPDF